MYYDILDIKDIDDNQRRGFAFEQIVRELLPWDLRPPISARARSEQLDAIFQWMNNQFIVEAKAKRGRIDLGSSDWEDFELKIRRRPHCIGLFLSLFEIDQKIVDRATNLNESGFTVILIADDTWDGLDANNIPFQEYLRYLVFIARTAHRPNETNFQRFLSWSNDTELYRNRVVAASKNFSAPFVRRYRHYKHDDIYVKREIDGFLAGITRELRPRSLMATVKRRELHDKVIDTRRARPKQFCIIKDFSGAGKTTLGVQVVSEKEAFFGFGAAARQSEIDAYQDSLSAIGEEFGLRELIHLDRPVVLFIDSLDEAGFMPGKRKEVLTVIKSIDRLAENAQRFGLITFPICVVFTIRYEYWRDWESLFEGLAAHQMVRRFSYFSQEETVEALRKYSLAYDFTVGGRLNDESMRVLSHPFNMLIFSEANEYRGRIPATDVLSETVLSLYFDRKKEELLKRPTLGFDSIRFMRLCGELAALVVIRGRNAVSIADLQEIVVSLDRGLGDHINQITQIVLSEQIIVRDTEETDTYRFRHMRFVEYLLAYFFSMELNLHMTIECLNRMAERYCSTDFVSIYNVHEFVRFICGREFSNVMPILRQYYSASTQYTAALLPLSRMKIGEGLSLPEDELAIINGSLATGNEEICWECFFVLAAKNNHQPRDKIANAFIAAWVKSKFGKYKNERVKLIRKMADLGLILEERVVLSVFNSDNYAEWLSLLDEIDRTKNVQSFLDIWVEMGGQQVLDAANQRKSHGFPEVQRILDVVIKTGRYPRGEFLVNEVDIVH